MLQIMFIPCAVVICQLPAVLMASTAGLHAAGRQRLVTAGLLTQAIKCFEAVVQAGVGTQPPAAQAAARLALARLLLAHTHNVAEARQHLERAVRCA